MTHDSKTDAGAAAAVVSKEADIVVNRICEYDDRTSPEEYPEMLLITPEELRSELLQFAEAIALRAPAHSSDAGTITLPQIPDDDADFTPELARKIISKYQELLSQPRATDGAARAAVIEECAKAAEAEAQAFLSPGYAAEQPMGSFCERFACEEVAKAIRALAHPSANRGGEA